MNRMMFWLKWFVNGCIFVYIYDIVDELLDDNGKYEYFKVMMK